MLGSLSGLYEVPRALLDGNIDSGTVWLKALVVDFDVVVLARLHNGYRSMAGAIRCTLFLQNVQAVPLSGGSLGSWMGRAMVSSKGEFQSVIKRN